VTVGKSGWEAVSSGIRLDKVQAWLGCNVRAQKERRKNKAETGGGRYCTVCICLRRCKPWDHALYTRLLKSQFWYLEGPEFGPLYCRKDLYVQTKC
jgi:hypothetical protein